MLFDTHFCSVVEQSESLYQKEFKRIQFVDSSEMEIVKMAMKDLALVALD